MQNLLRFAGAVAEHRRIEAPMGSGRFPLVDTRDVGAAAAAVLRDPDKHAGQAYALTGPEALSYDEVAGRLSAVVGHPIVYDAQPPEAFRAGLVADNVPSAGVAALLGRPPTAIEAFFADHRPTYVAGASRSHL
jgi:uncharacterized protein YbjT (DUF2867 family)